VKVCCSQFTIAYYSGTIVSAVFKANTLGLLMPNYDFASIAAKNKKPNNFQQINICLYRAVNDQKWWHDTGIRRNINLIMN